jgi:hypothetical protein
MSGGSMNYLYSAVCEAHFVENTLFRKALRRHLIILSEALRAVEWNDSGDGADNEDFLIANAIGCTQLKESIQEQLEENHEEIRKLELLRDFIKEIE